MLSANAMITDSLAPAVAISALGLLILGLNQRITTVGSRVRELTRELRAGHGSGDAVRIANIQRQIPLFLRRGHLIRNALFLLFGALGMMVLTAFAIALSHLNYLLWKELPAWSFLAGLLLLLLAAMLETVETILNMQTLMLDVQDVTVG